jgi:hypothetical protein
MEAIMVSGLHHPVIARDLPPVLAPALESGQRGLTDYRNDKATSRTDPGCIILALGDHQ